MVNNYPKCKEGIKKMNNDSCDIIDISKWLLDIISNILGCNCKNQKHKAGLITYLDLANIFDNYS